jgi:hypothetical protein
MSRARAEGRAGKALMDSRLIALSIIWFLTVTAGYGIGEGIAPAKRAPQGVEPDRGRGQYRRSIHGGFRYLEC